jgi:hypothetical protein
MDAVVLVGKGRRVALAGEAKWAKSEDGRRVVRTLERKLNNSGLPLHDEPRYLVCARETVTRADEETLVVTAADIFA